MKFITLVLNWCLKLLMGYTSFTFMNWLGSPEWIIISVMVVAVSELKVEYTK